jgi:DNA-binding Lrp family transcriptional regulator
MVHLLGLCRSASIRYHAGMSDIPPEAPLRTDGPHAGIPVHDAAHLLGISENAVRARLRRGTLVGVKRDASWYVLLRDTDVPTVPPSTTSDVPGDTPRDAPSRVPSHTAVHEQLIEELRADKRFLQEQLDRALRQLEAERQRADVLTALGAGTTSDTAQEAPESPPANERGTSGVLAWWRRLWSA